MVATKIYGSFQFHYGAMGGVLCDPNAPAGAVFQFHYGAMGGRQRELEEFEKIPFNSTMVRWEAPKEEEDEEEEEIFQFHYGAMGGHAGTGTEEVALHFQFHYGAMGGIQEIAGVVSDPSFNSTMVRWEGS